jgi:hypothetical protein
MLGFMTMKKYSFGFCLFLNVAVLALWRNVPARAEVVLVDDRTPPCPIVATTNGNSPEAVATRQLAAYLEKISGKPFPVQAPSEPLPQRAIVVGAHGIAAPKELGADGFLIETQGQRLTICGGGEQGTAYGVFAFLEDQLGCRWWSWNEEDVPRRAAIKLGDLHIRQQPAFALHDIFSLEAQTNRNDFVYKSRAKSTLQFTGNHTMYKMLTEAAKANPEFWPMNDKGERKPNDLHFNYLAPGIAEALAVELGKEVEKRKGDLENFIYFAGQGDWYGGLDQSEDSKKVYEEEAWTDPNGHKRSGSSAPLLRMINRTAALLQEKYPGIKIGTFAYMSTDSPPGKTVPAENVVIWLPRLRYGTTLGIEEAASENNPDEKSRQRSQAIKASIERWAQIAPGRFYIWEYGANYNSYVKPWPSLRAMAENLKFYKKVGVQGVMIQSNYGSFGGDLAVLKNWIWSKLLWNPDWDVSTLLKQFCDGYYGPASAEMQEYVNTLEDSVRTPKLAQFDEFYEGSAYLRPEVLAAMKATLKRAEEKTQGEGNAEYYRRVREAGASLDAIELWTDGTLVERDGRLIRADIDKENGGEDTFERAQQLPKYLRGSSKNEFGAGVSQQRTILPANGGPLYTLERNGVTAKIAPYQGFQRLWKVLRDGREIIQSSFMGFDGRYFVPDDQAGDKVEMEGEMGYGLWDPKAYQLQRETIAQDEGGALRWSGTTRQLIPGKPLTVVTTASTAYPAASLTQAQQYTVEIKTPQGWEDVAIGQTPSRAIPPVIGIEPTAGFTLRITTPDKKVTVLDRYNNQPVTGYAASFATTYGTRSWALVVYVRLAPVNTEYDKAVPAFERVITIDAAP